MNTYRFQVKLAGRVIGHAAHIDAPCLATAREALKTHWSVAGRPFDACPGECVGPAENPVPEAVKAVYARAFGMTA